MCEFTSRDFIVEGTGLPTASIDYVMLFNILHSERPELLLNEAFRVLSAGGILGIMHWNYHPGTPRGPSMDIPPQPEQCRDWAIGAGFALLEPRIINLPPYHYGIVLRHPE